MTMKDVVIAIISSGLLSGLLATVVTTISNKRNKEREDDKNLKIGLRLILLSTLKRDGKDALQKGEITKEDYEAFLASYNAYKALDGDGWADKVFKQVGALPVKLDD